ncbi:metalloregulator ArsR/SmtB family transcription factor [Candidatus Gracilibacteria bacterium]|nr:metalloregulator ArsR/SmtB family transcription factor [Candidatus Gracilibacteria bacterium]
MDELEIAKHLKILSEPHRIKIIRTVCKKESCVCELQKKIKIPQNLLSHHLKVLKDCDILIARKEGRFMHYSLNKLKLKSLFSIFSCLFSP